MKFKEWLYSEELIITSTKVYRDYYQKAHPVNFKIYKNPSYFELDTFKDDKRLKEIADKLFNTKSCQLPRP